MVSTLTERKKTARRRAALSFTAGAGLAVARAVRRGLSRCGIHRTRPLAHGVRAAGGTHDLIGMPGDEFFKLLPADGTAILQDGHIGFPYLRFFFSSRSALWRSRA